MSPGRRNLLGILLLAVLLRLAWPMADPADRLSWSTGIYTDPPANTLPARHAVEHGDWNRVRIAARLFYPLLNALAWVAFRLAGVGRAPLQFLAAFLGVATVAVLALALRRGRSPSVALPAALFLATTYWIVMYSRVLMAEGVTLLLLAIASAAALRRGARAAAMAGAAAVAATLFGKFHGAGYLPALFLFLALRERRLRAVAAPAAGGGAVVALWVVVLFLPHRTEILEWIRDSPVRGTGTPPALAGLQEAFLEVFKTYRTAWMFHRLPVLSAIGGFFALWTFSGRRVLRRRLEDGTALFALWLVSMYVYLWLLPYTAPRYFVLLAPALVVCAAAQVARWLDGEGCTLPDPRHPLELAAVAVWAALLGFGAIDAVAHYRFWMSTPTDAQLLAGAPSTHDFASVTRFTDRARFVAPGLALGALVLAAVVAISAALRRRAGGAPVGRERLRAAGRVVIVLVLVVNLGQWAGWALRRHDFIDRTVASLAAMLGPGAVAIGPFAPLLTLGTDVDAVPFFGSGLDADAVRAHAVTHAILAPPGGVEALEAQVPGITGRMEMVHWWPLLTTTVHKLELYRIRGTSYVPSAFEQAIAAVRERDWARGESVLARYRAEGGPETAELLLYESHCRFGLGDPAAAERLLERALARRPDNSVLYMNLGILAARRGDGPAARRYWREGLRLDPSNAQLRRLLGGDAP